MWWGNAYGVTCARRTMERFKELLRSNTQALVDVVWQGKMTVSEALSFAQLCPWHDKQRKIIESFGAEEFGKGYKSGRLPVDGMLIKRVRHSVDKLDNPSDEEMEAAIKAALVVWREEREKEA